MRKKKEKKEKKAEKHHTLAKAIATDYHTHTCSTRKEYGAFLHYTFHFGFDVANTFIVNYNINAVLTQP